MAAKHLNEMTYTSISPEFHNSNRDGLHPLPEQGNWDAMQPY